jgi:hypothetical protein
MPATVDLPSMTPSSFAMVLHYCTLFVSFVPRPSDGSPRAITSPSRRPDHRIRITPVSQDAAEKWQQ